MAEARNKRTNARSTRNAKAGKSGTTGGAARQQAHTPKQAEIVSEPKKRRLRRPRAPKSLRAAGAYFKGAWHELRHTKWPTRGATWSLTLAVILFSAFVTLFIIAADYVFNWMFERLIA